MNRCIYCQLDQPPECYTKAEHVVPQSFGKFRDNFTLRGEVCDDCNQYFGDTLELYLARDTLEGQSRFRHGVKRVDEFKPLIRDSRLIVRCAEGPLSGCYMLRYFSPEKNDITVKPMPQAGFWLREPAGYRFFLPEEIPTQAQLDGMGFDAGRERAILGLEIDPPDLQRLLANKGISFNFGGPLPIEPRDAINTDVESKVDHVIWRAVAKIAFNYLAYGEGAAFVHHPAFDAARRYIRHGEVPEFPMVQMVNEAILAEEPIEGMRVLGHLITVNWASDGVSVLAQVALFNQMTYRVILALGFTGPPP